MNIESYLVLSFVVMAVMGPISVSFTKYLYLVAGVNPSQVQEAYLPHGRRELVQWLEAKAGYSRQFRTMFLLTQGMMAPWAVSLVVAIALWLLHLEGYLWVVAVVAGVLTVALTLATWLYGRRVEAGTRGYFAGCAPHPYIQQARQEERMPRKSRHPVRGPRLGGGESSVFSDLLLAVIPVVIFVLFGLVLMSMQ